MGKSQTENSRFDRAISRLNNALEYANHSARYIRLKHWPYNNTRKSLHATLVNPVNSQ